MSSTPQSLPSRPPPIPADDGFEGTPASREATTDETDASPCEFEIDWENIWHGGKRLMGAKRRPRHRRVIGTKIKESWIYRHGANLEHHGQAAEETQFEEPSYFKSGIDCGWAKLEDYYVKSDRTPVYRAALALHPSYGYDYFERHWKTAMDRPQWYNDMQSAVGSLFGEYGRQAEVEAQAQAGLLEGEVDEIEADVNDYSSFGKRSIRSLNTQRKKVKAVSELDIFQTRPIYAHDLDVADPLEWWNRHQLEYPVLYRMALDLFSIPGMSSECERVFSQTKKMITDERNRLAPEVVEADQLQKQWLMRGLVV
ncbi:hypothetical protein FOFC_03577 [Fusarium oxysporum]|nr:hypothetical protein FOFC_03577 [Fusarium oxysporum]